MWHKKHVVSLRGVGYISVLVLSILIFASSANAAKNTPTTKTINLSGYADGTKLGSLTYNKSGSTFDFTFTGKAPVANDWYAIVLGTDPYNHPETTIIIDYPRSDGDTGDITITKSIELNRDLKKTQVWLVWSRDIAPSPYYEYIVSWGGWNPQYYLFGKGFVNFNDTDV